MVLQKKTHGNTMTFLNLEGMTLLKELVKISEWVVDMASLSFTNQGGDRAEGEMLTIERQKTNFVQMQCGR